MDAMRAWQSAQGQLQMDMPKATYDTWVKNAKLISHSDNKFIIGIDNAYARDWLANRLTTTAEKLLSGIMESPQRVEFIVQSSLDNTSHENIHAEQNFSEPTSQIKVSSINSRYTFQSFVVGPNNRLAHAASMAVAENPAKAYNPLFLYGGVGLGKTHLLHAIGSMAAQNRQNFLYISSEEFTNDLINAIRRHDTTSFREKYRKIDVLLIDDIHFIAGKESTQEEFFHTFNTLHGQEKQIVISSDRPPKAMLTLEERLRSRFEWGLIVDIQPPELETRIAILRFKAEQAGRSVPDELLENIAIKFHSNIRELEGALTRVLAFSDLSGKPLSAELVNMALVDLIPENNSPEPAQVLNTVARNFNLTSEELLSRNRSKKFAFPRQIAMYIMREFGNESLPQIGETLGGRDHTTVLYACEKIAAMIEKDEMVRRQVMQIRDEVFSRQVYA